MVASSLMPSICTSSGSPLRRLLFLLVLSLAAQAHCFLASPSSPNKTPAFLKRTYRGGELDGSHLKQAAAAATSLNEQPSDGTVSPSSSSSSTAIQHQQHPLVYDPIPLDDKTNSSSMTLDDYKQQYQESIHNPGAYWSNIANRLIDWDQTFTTSLTGNLHDGNVEWFADGTLNVCYNAVDRHAFKTPDKVALLWEGDEPHQMRQISYLELQQRVSQIANALAAQGVKQGDVVTIYMPMVPELPMTMLACARLGAVHSVVFAGFSADALAARVVASNSKHLVTANHGKRASKTIQLLEIVEAAVRKANHVVQAVLVWDHGLASGLEASYVPAATDNNGATATATTDTKYVNMDALVKEQSTDCPPVSRRAEDPLFILYTSGSTGQPKGLVHTTGGYSVYAAHTTQTTFALDPLTDTFACVADCGWITGHSYVVYGPLLLGATSFLFESTPLYPNPGRYWDMVQRHKLTHFYTAPTAIRSLMQHGSEIPQQYDLSSLKVLGTVGEPINPEAWRWYNEFIGRSKCTIVDTYWQTETGGHILSNLPGCTPMKPGSCTLPLFGIDAVVLDAQSGQVIDVPTESNDSLGSVEGVLAIRQPWPGMARTCLNDHERFMTVYLKPYPGYYFTGDAVTKDQDGYHFITGRVDDVLNVSGHRIGTAEVESALVLHPSVAQAAVVGTPHPIKGEAIVGFCMLDVTAQETDTLIKELVQQIRSEIGAFASPDKLYIVPTLPMTRSGKIMRRILRKIVAGEADQLGDTSTLADSTIVETLIEMVQNDFAK
ncbi:hypothetical protein MPSEU_000768300 [Mayamaea pseudoterrestris]|nr:hypothetical protein MPSEU_000768300 [Mayamaea pseudoterrestris]